MKNWILACALIVSPVLAANDDVVSLELGEVFVCPSAGGCIAMSKDTMRLFLAEFARRAAAAGCKVDI